MDAGSEPSQWGGESGGFRKDGCGKVNTSPVMRTPSVFGRPRSFLRGSCSEKLDHYPDSSERRSGWVNRQARWRRKMRTMGKGAGAGKAMEARTAVFLSLHAKMEGSRDDAMHATSAACVENGRASGVTHRVENRSLCSLSFDTRASRSSTPERRGRSVEKSFGWRHFLLTGEASRQSFALYGRSGVCEKIQSIRCINTPSHV